MKTLVAVSLTLFAMPFASLAGEAPAVKTLSDAELYLKAKRAEMEKAKAEAIAKARADIERRIALKYQAQMAQLKRQLIEQQARVAELTKKVDDLEAMLKSGGPTAPIPPTPKTWGKPVFSDNFARSDPSDRWDKESLQPGGNYFKVAEGMLTGKEKILTIPRFSGKAVRVEYDTWTLAENPCDASIYLENPDKDFSAFAGIGGEMNRACRLVVDGKELARKGLAALVRGRRQHMVVECGRNKMRIEVDGETILQVEGDQTPARLDNVRLGLYSWTPGMHFDNVRVYVIE